MYYYLLIFLELFVIFFTSRYIFSALLFIFKKLFFSQRIAVAFIGVVFFPGVFVHEFSHLLMAGILQVKGFHVEFKPVLHEGGLKLGSATIARSDPVRRMLIGLAPIAAGVVVLFFLTSQIVSLFPFRLNALYIILNTIYLYAIFVVSNTMFSSKKDVEGGVGLLICLVIIIGGLEFAGVGVLSSAINILQSPKLLQNIPNVVFLFAIPAGINLLFVGTSLRLLRRRY